MRKTVTQNAPKELTIETVLKFLCLIAWLKLFSNGHNNTTKQLVFHFESSTNLYSSPLSGNMEKPTGVLYSPVIP